MSREKIAAMAGFIALPVISAIAALIAVPFLIRFGGVNGWAAIAIGQGVGATVALIVTFGWGTSGPAQVARAPQAALGHIYWTSVCMRLAVLTLVLPLGLFIVHALAPAEHATALLVCAAVAMQGMTPGWYLTGLHRPFAIAALETGPRAAAQVSAIVIVAVSGDLYWFGAITLAVEALFVVFSAILIARPQSAATTLRDAASQARQQWPLVLSALTSALYTRAATPIVAAVSPIAVPLFAAADRVQQFGRTGLRPIAMFFQGWVAADTRRSQARAKVASLVTIGAGLVIGVAVAVFLPPVSPLLFSDALHFTWIQSSAIGILLASVAGSMSTGLYYLIPLGAVSVFSWTSGIASILGVPLLVLLTTVADSTGALVALASVEALVFSSQAVVAYRLIRTRDF